MAWSSSMLNRFTSTICSSESVGDFIIVCCYRKYSGQPELRQASGRKGCARNVKFRVDHLTRVVSDSGVDRKKG